MFTLFCLLLTIIGCRSEVTDGTTLVSSFLIHRHGDRTPVEQTINLCTDPEAVYEATLPYGYGQLTDVGKRRAFALGQYIQQRYGSLISDRYNKSEIYIRSTDSTRTKMTVLTAMTAVYPAKKGSWSQDINWEPIPYTTVPVKYDFNLANLNCPTFTSDYYAKMMTNPARLDKYSEVMEVIADVFGSSIIKSMPVLAYAFYDAFASQLSLNIPLDDKIAEIMPDIETAAGEAIDVVFGDDSNIDLQGGVLLNEFFNHASSIINGEDTPRLRVYSAHDLTVYSFMAVCQIYPRQGVPKYASAFSLELRKVDGTDQYVVLAVYQPSPGQDLVYLPIKGCDNLLCDIETFRQAVSNYILDENTWRTKCGFTHDIEIDDSSIA